VRFITFFDITAFCIFGELAPDPALWSPSRLSCAFDLPLSSPPTRPRTTPFPKCQKEVYLFLLFRLAAISLHSVTPRPWVLSNTLTKIDFVAYARSPVAFFLFFVIRIPSRPHSAIRNNYPCFSCFKFSLSGFFVKRLPTPNLPVQATNSIVPFSPSSSAILAGASGLFGTVLGDPVSLIPPPVQPPLPLFRSPAVTISGFGIWHHLPGFTVPSAVSIVLFLIRP